jgi:hypothetical protein
MGVYLMGVHPIGVYLMGIHLVGVHLMGVHLMIHFCYGPRLARLVRVYDWRGRQPIQSYVEGVGGTRHVDSK